MKQKINHPQGKIEWGPFPLSHSPFVNLNSLWEVFVYLSDFGEKKKKVGCPAKKRRLYSHHYEQGELVKTKWSIFSPHILVWLKQFFLQRWLADEAVAGVITEVNLYYRENLKISEAEVGEGETEDPKLAPLLGQFPPTATNSSSSRLQCFVSHMGRAAEAESRKRRVPHSSTAIKVNHS